MIHAVNAGRRLLRAAAPPVAAAAAALTAGCLVAQLDSPTAPLYCEVDGHCPEGWYCYAAVGRCATSVSDLDPPQLLSFTVTPPRVSFSTFFTVTLEVDERIDANGDDEWFEYTEASEVWIEKSSPQRLYLRDRPPVTQSLPPFTFGFNYNVADLEAPLPDGVYPLRARLRDAFGNRTEVLAVGTLQTDYVAPDVVDSQVPATPAQPGDTVTVSFRANEALRTAAVVLVRRPLGENDVPGMMVGEPVGNDYVFEIVIPNPQAAGSYEVEATLVDLAGNTQSFVDLGSLEIN